MYVFGLYHTSKLFICFNYTNKFFLLFVFKKLKSSSYSKSIFKSEKILKDDKNIFNSFTKLKNKIYKIIKNWEYCIKLLFGFISKLILNKYIFINNKNNILFEFKKFLLLKVWLFSIS